MPRTVGSVTKYDSLVVCSRSAPLFSRSVAQADCPASSSLCLSRRSASVVRESISSVASLISIHTLRVTQTALLLQPFFDSVQCTTLSDSSNGESTSSRLISAGGLASAYPPCFPLTEITRPAPFRVPSRFSRYFRESPCSAAIWATATVPSLYFAASESMARLPYLPLVEMRTRVSLPARSAICDQLL